jgi:hypothetical protein
MKLIVATPKSGSTYFTRWHWYQDTSLNYLAEHFQPEHFPQGVNTDSIDIEIDRRLAQDHTSSVIKIHTGKETPQRVWDWVGNHPVHLVKRKDTWAQTLGLGLSYLSNNWTLYPNEHTTYHCGFFLQSWFDDLVWRLDDLEQRQHSLNVASTVYYEDIYKYTIDDKTARMPVKQHAKSIEQLEKHFYNIKEVKEWHNDWIQRRTIS